MADKSKIEWTDASWTPVRARNKSTGKVGWYCEHATPGCEHCYAESMNARLGTGLPFKPGHRKDVELFLDEDMLLQPLRWKKPRMIFVCSMTDLFADFVPDEVIDKIFAVMALCPQHTFQVLTKRAARMREYCADFNMRRADALEELVLNLGYADPLELLRWPLPNVWLGVSAEDQKRADERIPHLLQTPAAVRFVSAEPLLGPIDFRQWQFDYGCGCGWGGDVPLDYCNECGWRGDAPGEIGEALCPECSEELSDYNACPECNGHSSDGMSFGPNSSRGLDWIIVGGESGPGARPMHPDWARSIRDQCAAAGVPYFFKQHGEFVSVSMVEGEGPHFSFPDGATVRRIGKRAAGRLLDGREHNEMPERANG